MRHILTSVVLLVLLFPALALGETMDDLVERDGLRYKKFTTVPFTGEITGKNQGSFRNGKRDGPWVLYHDNGQLYYQVTYKDGKKDGPWVVYFDNGQLSGKGTWKDGKKDGPYVGYWDDGQLFEKGTYKDGEQVGPWVGYWKNRGLSYKGTWKNDKRDGPWVTYNYDGTVDERYTGTFKDDVKVD